MNELKVILNELEAVASPKKKKNFKVIIKILKLKKLIKIEIEYINITKKKKGGQIHKVLKLPSQIFIF